jgi:hypothetical protein
MSWIIIPWLGWVNVFCVNGVFCFYSFVLCLIKAATVPIGQMYIIADSLYGPHQPGPVPEQNALGCI